MPWPACCLLVIIKRPKADIDALNNDEAYNFISRANGDRSSQNATTIENKVRAWQAANVWSHLFMWLKLHAAPRIIMLKWSAARQQRLSNALIMPALLGIILNLNENRNVKWYFISCRRDNHHCTLTAAVGSMAAIMKQFCDSVTAFRHICLKIFRHSIFTIIMISPMITDIFSL